MDPLFLISNDDGVHAPGIKALAHVASEFGEVVIVAPHVERSATSHSITIHMPLRVEELSDNIFAVEGSPADCVLWALSCHLKRRPTFVLSGVNRGGNLGQDTLYSGTIGAAMEGRLQGIKAIAFSIEGKRPYDYETAKHVIREILLNADSLENLDTSILNVNIPSVPVDELKGYRGSCMGRRIYDLNMAEGTDPRGKKYYWLGGGGGMFDEIENSDCVNLDQNYVTLSYLKPSLYDEEATDNLSGFISKVAPKGKQ